MQFTSPPEPPFTKEDAVTFATSGKGTMTEKFPEDIGTKEDYIEGYHVTRETNAKEISEEIYQVTFVEHWEKGDETGTYSFSFQVEKGSLMRDGEQGEALPYY
ncbi:hypothetical protein D7Z54_20435 [Salibacterium salarium]|uniref:Uncharacterized protein n=1 Tax=Salibacterium salarium TaxID=284579 RepID=A0A3R9QR59_9BACI|nr:hypothetical protein D7Z54_20435 [Salibacterium salarium]